MLLELLVLARGGARARRTSRRSDRADGAADQPRQRRRLVFRGDRRAHRRVSRQLSAGARASGVDQRGRGVLAGAHVSAFYSSLGGGFLGTLVLTTMLRAASEF